MNNFVNSSCTRIELSNRLTLKGRRASLSYSGPSSIYNKFKKKYYKLKYKYIFYITISRIIIYLLNNIFN